MNNTRTYLSQSPLMTQKKMTDTATLKIIKHKISLDRNIFLFSRFAKLVCRNGGKSVHFALFRYVNGGQSAIFPIVTAGTT